MNKQTKRFKRQRPEGIPMKRFAREIVRFDKGWMKAAAIAWLQRKGIVVTTLAIGLLSGTALAGTYQRLTKPTVCEQFTVYESKGGGSIAECHDGGRPKILRTWGRLSMKRPDGSSATYALGWSE